MYFRAKTDTKKERTWLLSFLVAVSNLDFRENQNNFVHYHENIRVACLILKLTPVGHHINKRTKDFNLAFRRAFLFTIQFDIKS